MGSRSDATLGRLWMLALIFAVLPCKHPGLMALKCLCISNNLSSTPQLAGSMLVRELAQHDARVFALCSKHHCLAVLVRVLSQSQWLEALYTRLHVHNPDKDFCTLDAHL